MYLIAAFCVAVVSYVLIKDMDGAVAETAVTMSFLCLGSIAGSYIFGAAWQDVNHIKATTSMRGASARTAVGPLRPGEDNFQGERK